MFLLQALSNVEKKYSLTKAKIATVIQVVRKLKKIVQLNQQPTNILTNYTITKSIVKHTSLVTIDLAKANIKLANTANQLLQFKLNIYYIAGVLNVVPNALSQLPTIKRDCQGAPPDTSNKLADIWANLAEGSNNLSVKANTLLVEPMLSNNFRKQLVNAYPEDRKYSAIYQALYKKGLEELPQSKPIAQEGTLLLRTLEEKLATAAKR